MAHTGQADDWKRSLHGEVDFCSRQGGFALKATIEAYWRARGHEVMEVMIVLHNVGFHGATRVGAL